MTKIVTADEKDISQGFTDCGGNVLKTAIDEAATAFWMPEKPIASLVTPNASRADVLRESAEAGKVHG